MEDNQVNEPLAPISRTKYQGPHAQWTRGHRERQDRHVISAAPGGKRGGTSGTKGKAQGEQLARGCISR